MSIEPQRVERCVSCGRSMPLQAMIAFWPVGAPDRVGYCCRPDESVPSMSQCFRRAVGPVDIHAIAPAVDRTAP